MTRKRLISDRTRTNFPLSEYFFPDPVVHYWKIRTMWAAVDILTVLSVWHVLAITLDRYVVVLHPKYYLRITECKR